MEKQDRESSESACNTVIANAQENVKSIIKDNFKQILEALNEKLNEDGIVVVNGYAQFFDTSSDNCDQQSWDIFWYLPLGASYQALTISRRETFNQLVINITRQFVMPSMRPPKTTTSNTRSAKPTGTAGSRVNLTPECARPAAMVIVQTINSRTCTSSSPTHTPGLIGKVMSSATSCARATWILRRC